MPNFWKSTNGIITIVGIGLVVVALIGVALYFAFGKEEKKPDNSKNNEEQQEQNAQTPNGQEVNVGKGNSVPTNTRTINNFGGSSYNSRSNSPINNGTSLTPRLSSMATMSNIKVNNTTSNNNNINRTNNSNRANNRVASRRPIANPLQQNQNNNLGNNPINNGNPPAGFGGANNNINNNNLLNNQNNNNLINNENNNINNNEIEDEGGNEEGNNNPQFPFNLPLNPGMGGIGNDIGEGAGGEGEGEGLPIENPPEEAMQQENINEAPQEPKKQGAQRLNTAVEKAVRRILLQKSVKKWFDDEKKEKQKEKATLIQKVWRRQYNKKKRKEAIKKSIGDFAHTCFDAKKASEKNLKFNPTDDIQGSMRELAKIILKLDGKDDGYEVNIKEESDFLRKKYLRYIGQTNLDKLMPKEDVANIPALIRDATYNAYDTLAEEMKKNSITGEQERKIVDLFNKEITRINNKYFDITKTPEYNECIKELPGELMKQDFAIQPENIILHNLKTINDTKLGILNNP